MSKTAWAAILMIAAVVVFAPAFARGANATTTASATTRTTDAERALQGRLMAPCCWAQTLDVHESEISTELRAELHERLARGDSAEAIEDDFAARFGERIRAVPKGKDPFSRVPLLVGFAMLASAVGLVAVLRRWARRGPGDVEPKAEPSDGRTDAYDERLDDELRRLDGE